MSAISPPLKWHDIPGFPGYRASDDGSIWTCWKFHGGGYGRKGSWVLSEKWSRLKPEHRKCDGRKRYNLRHENGNRVRKYGSHFILLAFVGPCPEGMEACHNDGDCLNDAAVNLRWDTHQENINDKIDHGTVLNGERINTAKITENDVRDIRRLRSEGKTLRELSGQFGVTQTMISLIYRRKNWCHVS